MDKRRNGALLPLFVAIVLVQRATTSLAVWRRPKTDRLAFQFELSSVSIR